MSGWTRFADTRDAQHAVGIARSLRLEIIAAYRAMQRNRRLAREATEPGSVSQQYLTLCADREERRLRQLLRIRREGIDE